MTADDIETRIGKALVATYGASDKEPETIRRVRKLTDRHRPTDPADRERFDAGLEWWLADLPNREKEHTRLKAALNNLGWYLAKKDKRRSRAIVSWVSEHPGQATAAAGVLLAVILRVSYSQFYNRLGTTPEEVGLGSPELLAASLPGAAIVVVAITTVVAVASIPPAAVFQGAQDRWLDEGRGHQSKSQLVLFIALVAINLMLFYLIFFEGFLAAVLPLPESVSGGALGAMIGGISGMLGAVCGAAVGSSLRANRDRRRGLRPYVSIQPQLVREAFIANGPVIAFAFLFLFLPLLAAERADRVKDAHPVEPISVIGFPLLAISADASRLVDGGDEYSLAGCVLYLGASSRNAVFYRREESAETGTIVRLLSNDVGGLESAVAEPPDDWHCWAEAADQTDKQEDTDLEARLARLKPQARAGSRFRVRYSVSRPSLVRVTAWLGRDPVEQVVDSASTGQNGVDMTLEHHGTYSLTLVAYGIGGGRVVRRGHVVVE